MGTSARTAMTSPASCDAFADDDAFVDKVLAELAAMEADGGDSLDMDRPSPVGWLEEVADESNRNHGRLVV